jgi:hypothetical protein
MSSAAALAETARRSLILKSNRSKKKGFATNFSAVALA